MSGEPEGAGRIFKIPRSPPSPHRPRSVRPPGRSAALLLSVFLVAATGCGSDAPDASSPPEPSEPLARALDSLTFRTIGSPEGDGSATDLFAEVLDVRAAPDGERLAILDAYPPFVRVYDRNGDRRRAFVEEGAGPGEARDPYALAASDSGLLLLQPGRVSLFDWTGELLHESADLAFWPISVTRGCGGDWVIYGPGIRPDADGRTAWLHVVGDTLLSRPRAIFRDSTAPQYVVRRSRPVAIGEEALVLYHSFTSPPIALWFSCPGYRVQRSERMPRYERRDPRMDRSVDRGAARVMLPRGMPIFTGLAVTPGGLLMSETVAGSSEEEGFTVLRLVGDGTETVGAVRADIKVFGSVPPGNLLLTGWADPVPTVRLLSARVTRFLE